MANDLINRLHNMKFTQATRYLDGQPETIQKVVRGLAAMFGNAGWEDFNGAMADWLYWTVESLCEQIKELHNG